MESNGAGKNIADKRKNPLYSMEFHRRKSYIQIQIPPSAPDPPFQQLLKRWIFSMAVFLKASISGFEAVFPTWDNAYGIRPLSPGVIRGSDHRGQDGHGGGREIACASRFREYGRHVWGGEPERNDGLFRVRIDTSRYYSADFCFLVKNHGIFRRIVLTMKGWHGIIWAIEAVSASDSWAIFTKDCCAG